MARPTLMGRLAAFGTRSAVRFAFWRAAREARREVRRQDEQVFRGFIQINLIRSH